MDSAEKLEREAFERWAARHGFRMPRYVPESSDYAAPITQAGWDAWQAARAQPQAESQDAKDAARWRVALPLLPCPGTFMDRDIERPEDWVSAIDAAMEKTP